MEQLLQAVGEVFCPLDEKFGLPRQSGLAEDLVGEIRLHPPYCDPDWTRGIDQYSHLWIVWGFSSVKNEQFSPTVRPPRLGGNKRLGVFATRSPFRPNKLGLTVVKLLSVRYEKDCCILSIAGLDMQNGTPVYDIKPYIPYADALPDACGGFAEEEKGYRLAVDFPEEWEKMPDKADLAAIKELLALDPRPAYQEDPQRVYFLCYGVWEVSFCVAEGLATVIGLKTRCEEKR